MSDEPKCEACGVPFDRHPGLTPTCRQLTAAHARIAELEVAVLEIKHECPWMGKWATERRKYATLRDGVKALATRCEQSSQGLSAIMPNGAAVYARMADELTALLGHNNNQEQP